MSVFERYCSQNSSESVTRGIVNRALDKIIWYGVRFLVLVLYSSVRQALHSTSSHPAAMGTWCKNWRLNEQLLDALTSNVHKKMVVWWHRICAVIDVWTIQIHLPLLYNHYAGEGYDTAFLLWPISFHVRWNKICLNHYCKTAIWFRQLLRLHTSCRLIQTQFACLLNAKQDKHLRLYQLFTRSSMKCLQCQSKKDAEDQQIRHSTSTNSTNSINSHLACFTNIHSKQCIIMLHFEKSSDITNYNT